MQLQAIAFRFLHEFQMAKFITHTHKHAPVRRLVHMPVAVIMIVIMIVVVTVIMTTATTKSGDH